ncbi:BlaI/MecI/CopY family transcriptional regulator [Winogradskya humida]|uniref:Penicillinase repressor n=1 Tax=Winogradskya humida TaxID=113566 RepID=A0ABQ3ZHN5_9ACTN|nr:BlaI/MecI/CopY family transcriptional regulator [Actinoplanes humidus]GIE18095.1 putative penicillinase repressor [Actinoplanes humidus]
MTVTTKDGRRAPGTLEAGVMEVLWAAAEPLTAAEVQREVGGELAYNTVQTILIRLHEKKVVERRKAGRGHAYWPVEDAATAAASQMRAALADRADRHAVLQQFAASLDDSDAKVLRQLLADAERRRPA